RGLFHPLRLALTARESGPELKALLPLMGRKRVIARLEGTRACPVVFCSIIGVGTASASRRCRRQAEQVELHCLRSPVAARRRHWHYAFAAPTIPAVNFPPFCRQPHPQAHTRQSCTSSR